MERKTQLKAEENKQEIILWREFDLPLNLLFKAYEDPEIVAQWMGTKVLTLENKRHGAYIFETTDPFGNKHIFSGTIHAFVPNEKIIRTFEMEGTAFPVQLEFLEFEEITAKKSKLVMHIIYRSVEDRDKMLKMPFAHGINLAHNRLQEVFNK